MKDVNKIILIGRLGVDPIQRQTKAGMSVAHFSLATSRRFTKTDPYNSGKTIQAEETQWHQIVAWGKQAETCVQYLKKGNSVYVEGQLRTHTYENKEKVSKLSVEVHVDNIVFLGGGKSGNREIEKPHIEVDVPVAMETEAASA